MNTRNIEDIYPLSPMQQGMLFHSLYAPESGVYFEQSSWLLRGQLNESAFEKAWQQIIDRHSALRTVFIWEDVEEPIQVVHRNVKLSVLKQDWRELTEIEQKERMTVLLKNDRKRGFNLSEAPLMRLILIRTAEEVHKFVLSHHHILLDGWSLPIIFQEVTVLYESFLLDQKISLPPCRPYRDYIAWLQRQDINAPKTMSSSLLYLPKSNANAPCINEFKVS